MRFELDTVVLRRPEPEDVNELILYRNDPRVTGLLGGFSTGYSRQDLRDWVERHRTASREVLLVIADRDSNRCLGHVGLYNIDHRVRSAEFAILIGDRESWGKGIGQAVSRAMLRYGIEELNLHRIHLEVLATNERAIHLYTKLGFCSEGLLRHAQFRNGRYVDVMIMSILETEFRSSQTIP